MLLLLLLLLLLLCCPMNESYGKVQSAEYRLHPSTGNGKTRKKTHLIFAVNPNSFPSFRVPAFPLATRIPFPAPSLLREIIAASRRRIDIGAMNSRGHVPPLPPGRGASRGKEVEGEGRNALARRSQDQSRTASGDRRL